MKVSRYLTIFAATTRWFLPQAEAHIIIDDCHKLFDTSFRSNDQVIAKYRSPFQAARCFAQAESYRRWLVIFCTMILNLMVPTVLLFSQKKHPIIAVVSLILGGILSLVWFHYEKSEDTLAPKFLFILLSVFTFVWVSITAVILFALLDPDTAFSFLPAFQPVYVGESFTYVLVGIGAFSFVVGLIGLICARIIDYRWRSIYIMSLTVIAVCSLLLSVMHNLPSNLYSSYFVGIVLVPFVLLTILVGFCLTKMGLR